MAKKTWESQSVAREGKGPSRDVDLRASSSFSFSLCTTSPPAHTSLPSFPLPLILGVVVGSPLSLGCQLGGVCSRDRHQESIW